MNIFQSAVKKLTAWYVAALLLVCLVFSVPIYVVSSSRLERGARKQADIVQGLDGAFVTRVLPQVELLREQQIRQDRQQLLRSIVIANLFILAVGTYWSYWFAKRTLKPIEEAHDTQARFTTDASHELRTPLATMQAEIEVALRDKQFTAPMAKKVLGSNLEEIARLRILSEQLLNLARLDTSKLQKKPLKLTSIIEDELKNLEKKYNVQITKDIQKDLTLEGDELLIRDLLSILVDNAVKYVGDKPPQLKMTAKADAGVTTITVTDHGIGIKASEIPHIFDRLYRGTNATRHSTDGHGLGLAIAKQIVDVHGGNIVASSSTDKGTTFTITLPK